MARRADRSRALAAIVAAALLTGAAPPDPPPVDADLPGTAPGFEQAMDTGPAPAFAQPKHDQPLDPVTAALVVARLVALHLLDSAADAQDAGKAAEAVRGFQAGVGLKPTGVLDRKTLAMMAL